MATVRVHVVLPAELAREIDKIAGPRGRSAFLVETAQREIKRRKLLAFLDNPEPAWKDENHPDIVAVGTAAWVHNLRHEKSDRQRQIDAWAEENDQ